MKHRTKTSQSPQDPSQNHAIPSRSGGSALSMIASAIMSIAFFLPWFNQCGSEFSGHDLAAPGSAINVENPDFYWLSLIGPLLCFLLFVFFKNKTKKSRKIIALLRFLFGSLGFIPVLNIFLNAIEYKERIKIRYGLWLNLAGFIMILVSMIMDLSTANNLEEKDTSL